MCGGGPTERPAVAARDNPPVVCRVFVAGVRRADAGRGEKCADSCGDGRTDGPTSLPSRFCAHSNPITTGQAEMREGLGCVIQRLKDELDDTQHNG